jgi:hypothetical protein
MTLFAAIELFIEISDAAMDAVPDVADGALHLFDVLKAAVTHFLFLVVGNVAFLAVPVGGDLVLVHPRMLGCPGDK